ncbi:MAG: hypothetical protein KAI43_14665 [Candidatus Aureabacteria bacterium]|nr:hypothetical protein [Candidatus Auribacterota bacterium]
MKNKYFITTLSLISAVITTSILLSQLNEKISLISFVFILWTLLPYILQVILSLKLEHPKSIALFNLISITAITLFSLYIYFDSNLIHFYPQSALVFIFVPIFHIVALSVITGLSFAFKSNKT